LGYFISFGFFLLRLYFKEKDRHADVTFFSFLCFFGKF